MITHSDYHKFTSFGSSQGKMNQGRAYVCMTTGAHVVKSRGDSFTGTKINVLSLPSVIKASYKEGRWLMLPL